MPRWILLWDYLWDLFCKTDGDLLPLTSLPGKNFNAFGFGVCSVCIIILLLYDILLVIARLYFENNSAYSGTISNMFCFLISSNRFVIDTNLSI